MKWNSIFKQADYIGITGSTLCLIHCMAMPVLFAVLAAKPTFDLWIDLDYIFLLINFAAVYWVAQSSHFNNIRVALWSFWILLAVTTLIAESIDWFEYITYLASFGLIFTHLFNIRHLRKCSHQH